MYSIILLDYISEHRIQNLQIVQETSRLPDILPIWFVNTSSLLFEAQIIALNI